MSLDQIEKLIKFMEEHGLTELQVKEGELEFKARRGDRPNTPFVVQHAPGIVSGTPEFSNGAAATSNAPAPAAAARDDLKEICSPIVGTFYRKPNPNAAPYLEVGDAVTKDSVVCIVEAMKVMNEIKAEVGGKIHKILVEDASPVEFGQALFLVEPD